MAQFSLHAYDADVWIPEFKGLDQSDVNMNPDLRFAAELQNVETPNGVLQPRCGTSFRRRVSLRQGFYITMLANFPRRYYTGIGTKEWLICFARDMEGGMSQFYYAHGPNDREWTPIEEFPSYSGSDWSYVCYEHTSAGKTVDVMLVTNKTDGMYMIIPPDRPSTWGDYKDGSKFWADASGKTWNEVKSPEWSIVAVNTHGEKIGFIERYADRIWGTDIAGSPDKLMYSAVYLPTEWRPYKPDADPDDPDWGIGQPEDGGGEIMQPSWDGDQFTGLKQFGDSLIAVKKNHIWRIEGTNPGVFEFREQYGGGTPYGNSLAVYGEKMYMAAEDGMYVYDGMTVTPFKHKEVQKLWPSFMETASEFGYMHITSCMFNGRYYISAIDDEYHEIDYRTISSKTIVFNMTENTVLYYPGSQAHQYTITYDSYYDRHNLFVSGDITNPYSGSQNTCLLRAFTYDSFENNSVFKGVSRWVSPWIDFGYKRIQKGGFDLYFVPEVRDAEVTMYFTIQTEKKKKTKAYTVKPLTEEQRAKPKEHRGKRLHFGGMGRKFRVIIEVDNTDTGDPFLEAPWRLIGGLQLVVETDPD